MTSAAREENFCCTPAKKVIEPSFVDPVRPPLPAILLEHENSSRMAGCHRDAGITTIFDRHCRTPNQHEQLFRMGLDLSQVINNEAVSTIVAGLVWPQHCHAFQEGPETPVDHMAVGLMARRIHAGDGLLASGLRRQLRTSINPPRG